MPSELVKRMRTKYPTEYADLSDADLEQKILAKFPAYADLATPQPDFRTETKASDQPGLLQQAGGMLADVGTGVLKGAGQTATNLGRFVHMIPGVSRATDYLAGTPGLSKNAFSEADRQLTPTNTAQSIGKGVEQIWEFFIPGAAVEKAGMRLASKVPALAKMARPAMEGLTSGGIAAAQGGDVAESGAATVLGALPSVAGPGLKRLRATIAERLEAKAAKRVTEGLGATTKRLKNEAQKIAPGFAKRGLGGSVESLAEQATTQVDDLGRQIGQTIRGPVGRQTRATAPIVDALEKAKGKLTTTKVGGTGELIVTDKPQWEALSHLQDVVREYGDELSVEQMNALKKIYARVTSRSGGYNEKAGELLNTAPEAAKSFAAILRTEENGVEALAKLNKEFGFWKSLQNVTRATVDRRSSQGKGLTAAIAPVVGAAAGAVSGDDLSDKVTSALVGATVGRSVTKALQSPQWKFVRARYANQLAQAIAGSDPERVGQIVGKVLAAEAAHAH